jgi:hypothetical protein
VLGALQTGGSATVLSQLDKLVEPLEKTLTAKLKSDAVKQEVCWVVASPRGKRHLGPRACSCDSSGRPAPHSCLAGQQQLLNKMLLHSMPF